MKFKIDENLPIETATLLQKYGHDAVTVIQEALGGAVDKHIANVCQSEKRTLVTLDTDFSDIRTYPPKDFEGIIVLRVGDQSKTNVLSIIQRLMNMLAKERVLGCLWIVEESRIRIRE